jgi:alkylation response protein AidB-like acyl-CoA dehydrogenase
VDLAYSAEDQAFRKELRAWLESAVPSHGAPPPPQDWPARRRHETGWQRRLSEAGYAGIHWPKDVGGRGASLIQQLVYYEETARARAPNIGVNFVGMQHGGPTLIAEGTDEQRKKHLPRILRGEEVWCQGFSEPSAGSDLASLSTRAELDGDHYVVTGHKIWTSYGQVADYCELLVRTGPTEPKHKGITWLIMPMDLKGIEIRPLKTILGESEFSEMFLDDVRVPAANRVGAENDGWRVANVTLRFERGTSFAGWIIELEQFVDALSKLANETKHGHRSLLDDDGLRREIGHLKAELDALWAMVKLSVCEAERSGVPGPMGSAIKLHYSELYQRIADMGMRVLGRAALSAEDIAGLPCREVITKAMHSLSLTIAAGTSQIQRNIISERILGLPKEERAAAR